MAPILLFIALLGCEAASERHTLDVAGQTRIYHLYVPKEVSGPVPLMVAFHGGGPAGKEKGATFERFTGLDAVADRLGFAVVYPSSWEGWWADGRTTKHDLPMDDLAFVDALIDDVAGRVAIDRTRVFSTGVSNGGNFTLRLACERTATFAGFASVIGSLVEGYTCTPGGPAPIWMINGTEDPLIHWEGGVVAKDLGSTESVPRTAAFWARNAGCVGEAAIVELPDVDPTDGTRVRRHAWDGCAAPVRLDEVVGMGHAYPGAAQYMPEALIGKTSREYDTFDQIAAWLLSLPPTSAPGSAR